MSAAKSVGPGPNVNGAFATWINAPCTNQRVDIAIQYHEHGRPKKLDKSKATKGTKRTLTVHESAVAFLEKSRVMVEAFDKQCEREKTAIKKRLRAALHMVQHYDAFNTCVLIVLSTPCNSFPHLRTLFVCHSGISHVIECCAI
jgi:hypothetical protein